MKNKIAEPLRCSKELAVSEQKERKHPIEPAGLKRAPTYGTRGAEANDLYAFLLRPNKFVSSNQFHHIDSN